ncbi:alpha/beta hydrolase [bacterium]|nr:alpha/beta hydrolase [bacterium]
MGSRLLFLILLMISASVQAEDPNPGDAFTEDASKMTLHIKKVVADARKGFITTEDKTHLNYGIFGGPQTPPKPLVIVPGKGETLFTYGDMISKLMRDGFGPIYMMEPRSQGVSDRALPSRPNVIHIEDFKTYAKDTIEFIDGPVKRDLAARGIRTLPDMIAHSAGAAVAELAFDLRPDLFNRGYVSIGPLYGIRNGRMGEKTRKLILHVLSKSFLEEMVVDTRSEAPRGSVLEIARNLEEQAQISTRYVTADWVHAAEEASETILKDLAKNGRAGLIVVGRDENVVSLDAIYNYRCQAQANGHTCGFEVISGNHSPHTSGKETPEELLALIKKQFAEPSSRCYREYSYLN